MTMNSVVILLLVIAILLAARRRKVSPISGPRLFAVFAVILLMHVTVIGGLMALNYWKHS